MCPFALFGLLIIAGEIRADSFTDPAPPDFLELAPIPATSPQKNPDGKFHAPPKPLPAGAVTHDWPSFLGPTHNLVSTETKLLAQFPKDGLKLVWEASRGSGYAAPAILDDRLVMFHRLGGEEIVECLHRETGERFWRFAYATAYEDRYGYNDGPRMAPVIAPDAGSVLAVGAEGKIHCLELTTGRVRWKRDLNTEFKLRQNFFGCGMSPLVEGDRVILDLGATGGPTIIALDVKTGRMLWGAGREWGQSYAAPIPATLHGKRRVLVFAGGETGIGEKPTGGLLCIDPADGKVDFTFPWRGRRRESVNGSAPLLFDGDKVLISECYGSGGAVVQVGADFSAKPLWTNETFGTHFMTAVQRDGYLYGVDGHGPLDASLVCVNAATGAEAWRMQPVWRETIQTPTGDAREMELGTYRSWLMPVDGRVLMLGEFGHLLWVELSPKGFKQIDRTRLFLAQETWTPPVLSHGLLYICQNQPDRITGSGPRLLCYDLRAEK